MAVESKGSCAGLRADFLELGFGAKNSCSILLGLRLSSRRLLVFESISGGFRGSQDLGRVRLCSGEAVGLIFFKIPEIGGWRRGCIMRFRLSCILCLLRLSELELVTLGPYGPLGASRAQLESLGFCLMCVG